MPERIAYMGSASVAGGPQIGFNRDIEVAGYHKFRIELAAGNAKTIDLGTDKTPKVKMLAIKSTAYDLKLVFTIDSQTDQRVLDEPLIIAGSGAMSLIGTKMAKLNFTNGSAGDVVVDVFVALDPS